MKTRCRPGDLAIILRDAPGYEENIGRIVEVHGPARQTWDLGVTWLIVPVTRQPYAVQTRRGKLYDREITVDDEIEHADAWMMPIRPGTSQEQGEVRQMLNAPGDKVTSAGDKLTMTLPVTVTAGVSAESPLVLAHRKCARA